MHSLISTLVPLALTATAVTAAPLQRRDPVWLPAQGGCWSDNVDHQRALDKNLGGFDDLTPAKCQSLCAAQSFNLAGVEFGRECFCGNTVFGNNRPTSASKCSMACSGDSVQMCGGPDAIMLYVKDSYPFTVGPVSLVPSYQAYENPTCWHDSASTRFLTGHPATDIPADQMTVQKCIDGCAAAGFSSAGLEFGRECYCGTSSAPLADSADISECNMPCLGDASQFCGGANRLLMYHKPGPVVVEPTPQGSWTPAQGGCWTDKVHDRALEHLIGGYEDLTPAKCQVLCEDAGFHLAGVEFGRECFCGNAIVGSNEPSSSGICNMSCTGDGSKICGGRNAINIYVKDNFPYKLGPTVLESYNGYSRTQCWQDSVSNRILKKVPATAISGNDMTVEKCIDGCAAAGYSSAGVEFGRECFCDNVTYPPGQSESVSECNKPCTGDASEYCGGADRILIYHKPSPPALEPHRGVIQILRADNDEVLGYVANRLLQQASFLSTEDKALIVKFEAPSGATSVTQAEVSFVSPMSGFRHFGLSTDGDTAERTLAIGSTKYVLLGGVHHSEPGAIPQYPPGSSIYYSEYPYESSVWTIDLVTGAITPQWINPDGSKPQTTFALYTLSSSPLLLGFGDLAAFNARYNLNFYPIKFKLIPRPVPVTHRGIIQVTREDTHQVVGYVSNVMSGYVNQLGSITTAETDAALVTFEAPVGANSVTQAEIAFVIPSTDYLYFGLSAGVDATAAYIREGHRNHLRVGGVHHTNPGEGTGYPQRRQTGIAYESSVWSINLVNGAMTAQWINDDLTKPPTTFSLYQGIYLYGHGDLAAFNAFFQVSQPPIKFTFLPRP